MSLTIIDIPNKQIKLFEAAVNDLRADHELTVVLLERGEESSDYKITCEPDSVLFRLGMLHGIFVSLGEKTKVKK